VVRSEHTATHTPPASDDDRTIIKDVEVV